MNENTKIKLTVATFIMLILFIIATVSSGTTWLNAVDFKIDENIRTDLLQEIEIKELRLKLEEQNNLLIKIVTDVEWIRKDMEGK